MASTFDPSLAGKQWGWRRFGRRSGVSILLSRVRCNGFGPRFYFDRWTVTVRLMFGYGELWARIPWRISRAADSQSSPNERSTE